MEVGVGLARPFDPSLNAYPHSIVSDNDKAIVIQPGRFFLAFRSFRHPLISIRQSISTHMPREYGNLSYPRFGKHGATAFYRRKDLDMPVCQRLRATHTAWPRELEPHWCRLPN